MTTQLRRTLMRRELEAMVSFDEPEGSLGVRLLMSPKVLLLFCEFMERRGERIEILELYGDPGAAEVRFFRRDG